MMPQPGETCPQRMGHRFRPFRGMALRYLRFPVGLRSLMCPRVVDQWFSSRLVESVSTYSVACGWVRR